MAVYCGVCAIVLHDATENWGPFVLDEHVWSPYGGADNHVRDTCRACAVRLRAVVTNEVHAIVEEDEPAIIERRRPIDVANEEAAEEARGRAEFEREFRAAWAARKGGRPL